MKKIYLVAALIAAAALGALILFGRPAEAPHVPIQAQFEDKIVYGTDASSDTAALEKDCQNRGGTFNSCGSVCPSDAEICIQVCAFTCEFGKK